MARATSRLSRVLVTGPLAPFAETYRRELLRRGYTRRSAVNELRQVARLSRWLADRELGVERLDRERVEEFSAFQRAGGRHRAQWSRPGLRCLLEVLDVMGVREHEAEPPALSPIETLLGSFERYLLSERALASGTVRGYVDHARKFLDGLPSGTALAEVTAADVTTALSRVSQAVSVATAQNFRAGLRAFLRFCFTEGIIAVDLCGAALAVTGRRRVFLPRGIEPAQARALLSSCDRRTALGRRDHAMLVTLLRLGLRAGEVARLRLDDLDWRAGELIIRGKGSRLDRLPMPVEVGDAITAYLQRGRPKSDHREVFLRARAPVRADRDRHGWLDRASGVPACRNRRGRSAPATPHARLRDGARPGPPRRDRPGTATQEPAVQRDLRQPSGIASDAGESPGHLLRMGSE